MTNTPETCAGCKNAIPTGQIGAHWYCKDCSVIVRQIARQKMQVALETLRLMKREKEEQERAA